MPAYAGRLAYASSSLNALPAKWTSTTRGLADSEIQLDLLGDKNQDMALEEVFQFVEAKEAGKWSAGHLSDTLGANASEVNIAVASRRN